MNAITQTPQAVTVYLDGDRILVHVLIKEGIETLEVGEMDRRVNQLES